MTMNCSRNDTIVSAKEHCRVEDSLVEALEAQRQVEPLSPVPTDETNVVSSNVKEEAAAVSKVEKPDEFMDSVRAFIRGIDVNAL
jgi:hypothetical protein